MPVWELAPLGWEAIATFTTGGLAVWAAYKVGRHQIKISQKQTEILAKQTEISDEMRRLEALKIRSDIFDRRFAVYRAAREWLNVFSEPLERLPQGQRESYLKARDEALFLFDRKVFEKMSYWYRAKTRFLIVMARLNMRHDDNDAKITGEILERVHRDIENLTDLFKEALDLTETR